MGIIDTSSNTIERLMCIANTGVQIIFRYYASAVNWKVITPPEAQAISNAGMQIGVVFEDGVNLDSFTKQNGIAHATSAYQYAKETIKQPFGSAIFFAIDLNVTDNQINNNIIPYFEGIKEALNKLSQPNETYKVGAYGCGAAVNALMDLKLCDYRWLSCSTSFNGTQRALEGGNYEMAQHFNANAEVCNIGVDHNTLREGVTDIGAFKL